MTLSEDKKKALNAFWFGYISNPILYDLPVSADWEGAREMVALSFDAGARWALRTSSELSPHIARFIEMLILLGIVDHEALAPPSGLATDVPIGNDPDRSYSVRVTSSEVVSAERRAYWQDIHGSHTGFDDWCEHTPA